ncbi:MAG TPA: rhodanese-like domain-containing protein [Verrucomicrobiae bacterium]|nr:rhodanese-like domain-containing protein [Verrucomicrobiae bacterium]
MSISQFKTSATPAELQRLAEDGSAEILDVRTPGEFTAAHIPGAVLLPLDALDAAAFLKARGDQSNTIYVICQSGGRARKAIEKFQRAGFEGCALVEGGMQGWMDAGLPVIRGERQTLPLMQQVQITVGIVSGAGAALALGVHPGFALLPLLTGCGLLFAGLTGTCGLAWVLAKMPWNRGAACVPQSCCERKA